EGRTQIGRQCGEYRPSGNPHRLRSGAINRHRDMWSARAEGRQRALEERIDRHGLDEFLADRCQFWIIEAAAEQLELQLQPSRVADTLDRWWRHDEQLAIGCVIKPGLQPFIDGDDISVRTLAAVVPRLEHDEAHAGIGQISKIVESGQAGYLDDMVDAGG